MTRREARPLGRGALGVLTVLAWVAVVAVVTAGVWWVVQRAGDQAPAENDFGVPSASAGATSVPTTAPTSTRSASSSPGSSPSTGVPTATPVRRTTSGVGGSVTVECAGATIRLVGAVPRSGFTVEQAEPRSDRVEIEFTGGGEDEHRTRVRAECPGGTPAFEVDEG